MSLLIGIPIGLGSAGVLFGMFKGGIELSKKIFDYRIRINKKKELKERLLISIKDYDFNLFQNVIYEIKQYDIEYKKSLFIKMKKQYFFYDKHTINFESFNLRFNPNYEEDLKEMIKREVSISLSTSKCVLDL